MRQTRTVATLPTALVSLALALLGDTGAGAADAVDYLRDIKPLLRSRCYSCHGALQQKARLRLDNAALIRQGGRSGPAIVPGKSADSVLLAEAVAGSGRTRMPPAKKANLSPIGKAAL